MLKYFVNIAACLVIMLPQPRVAGAQWEQATNFPIENRCINCFASVDSFLFAGTDCGLFRSSNDGATWFAVDSGINPYTAALGVQALYANGNMLFAAVNYIIYCSSNDGANWIRSSNGLEVAPGEYISVSSFASCNGFVFAGTGYGIYRSSNNGANWDSVNNGISNYADIIAFAVNGNNVIALTLTQGLFRTSNNGNSWAAIDSGLNFDFMSNNLLAIAANGDTLIVASYTNGNYVSTNGGDLWYAAPDTGLQSNPLLSNTGIITYSLLITEKYLYAGTDIGLYRSSNNGNSWDSLENSLPASSIANILFIFKGNIFIGTKSTMPSDYSNFGSGIVVSLDKGSTWALVNNGLTNPAVTAIAVSGKNIIASSSLDPGNGDTFFSSDSGNSWTADTGLFDESVVTAFSENGKNIFAITNSGFYNSIDNGENWLLDTLYVLNESSGIGVGALSLYSSGNLLLIGSGGVLLSTNAGASWVGVDSGLPINNTGGFQNVVALTGSNGNFFAAAEYGNNTGVNSRVYRTTNDGIFWEESDTGITDPYVRSLTVCGGYIVAGTDSGIFISTNEGNSWIPTARGGFYQGVYSFAVIGDNIFAGTIYGVYISTNKGSSWSSANDNLPFYGITINALAIGNGYVYAGTNYTGVWRRPLSDFGITSVQESHPLLSVNVLLSNYPNPFSSSTQIQYSVSQEGNVSLSIVNEMGVVVASLINERQTPGMHTAVFNGGAIPAGAYFARYACGNTVLVKPLLLLK